MNGSKTILFSLLMLCIFCINAECQKGNLENLSPAQLKRAAKTSIRNNDIYSAIFYYEKYRKLNSKDHSVNFELAGLHQKARNYTEARELYKIVVNKAENEFPLSRFHYAEMLKAMGEYDSALIEFNRFRKESKGKEDAKGFGKLVKNEIAGCDSAMKILQNPANLTITNLNSTINSPHIELSPIPYSDNSFIYSSLKADSILYFKDEITDTNRPVRQFYKAKKQGMDWIGGEPLDGTINIRGVETGNGVFSRDGKRFYFTRCQKNWQGKTICAIYYATREKGEWGEPVKLPPVINNPNYTSTQPAVGRTAKSDREILYFVSDRPGGKGGLDIWYTVWNEEKNIYSNPRSLGGKINTEGDEMTPFYNFTNRTLYFSSTGLPGMGGLDVFRAFGERNKWSMVKNMGYPVNTSYDDLYFTVSRKQEDGFIVSNRPGTLNHKTCCDDIYYYHWNDFINITVTGTIYPFEQDRFGRKRDLSDFDFMNPSENIKPLAGSKIALYMQDRETKEYIFMDRYTTSENGRFYFTLIPDQEYEFKMEGLSYFDSKNYLSTEFFTFSDTIQMPPTWVNVLSDKPIVLENIYYDFNSADLSQKAKNVLDTTLLLLLKEAPEFIIEIGSHTDSIGETKYNLELSQDRADNVVKYLESKGINGKRLIPKGYGAQKPIAANYNPDGSDNVEGRDKNRRTEFRIVGSLDALGGEEDEEY